MLIYVFVDYNYMYIFSYARSPHLAKLYVFNYFILIVISPFFKVDSHIIIYEWVPFFDYQVYEWGMF